MWTGWSLRRALGIGKSGEQDFIGLGALSWDRRFKTWAKTTGDRTVLLEMPKVPWQTRNEEAEAGGHAEMDVLGRVWRSQRMHHSLRPWNAPRSLIVNSDVGKRESQTGAAWGWWVASNRSQVVALYFQIPGGHNYNENCQRKSSNLRYLTCQGLQRWLIGTK